MKLLSIALLVFSFGAMAQQKDWSVQKCSNSDGSVMWESTHEAQEIRLKYSNFIEGILELDLSQVSIRHSETKILDDKIAKSCTHEHKRKVYASKVLIVPAATHPEILSNHFPENKIYTEVICTEVSLKHVDCRK